MFVPTHLHSVLIRTWGGGGKCYYITLYIFLVEKRLVSSTLPSRRDCLLLEKLLMKPGKDVWTRDAFRKKGEEDLHLLLGEGVEEGA